MRWRSFWRERRPISASGPFRQSPCRGRPRRRRATPAPLRRTQRLAGLRTIDIGDEFGPEHIAIGPDGKLYAAMTSGNLLRMDPDGGKQEVFANTGGRVLGFDFDA